MINKQYKDRMNKIEQGCKRSVDFVIAACCLVVFSPLALVCALAIRKEDGLPVIYKQERITFFQRSCTPFLKFRQYCISYIRYHFM